jgi:hypothetical protein
MKRNLFLLFFFVSSLLLAVNFLLGCSQPKAQVAIVSKELVANGTNMAVVKGKIKNEGSGDAQVMVKAKLFDDAGNVLDEPYEMVSVKKGETADFEVKSSVNFYKVKKFEVAVE